MSKNPDERTVAEIQELRSKFCTQGGCCNRFADQQACDCLDRAVAWQGRQAALNHQMLERHSRATASTRTPDPTYPAPGGRAGDTVKGHSGSKYVRKIRSCITRKVIGEVDVYSVIDAYPMPMARSHAAKKILCAGLRDKGGTAQDIREAIDALKEDLKQLEAGE